MVGELVLEGHLTIGLFPKLGYLDGLRRLLQGGADFLDRANGNSASTYKVWDVNWGSVFTRANGSAISMITNYALRKQNPATHMPDNVQMLSAATSGGTPAPGSVCSSAQNDKPMFRRSQRLHIISMSRTNDSHTTRKKLVRIVLRIGKVVHYLVLIGLVILFCLFGAFGTAAIITNGLISKLVCWILRVQRPSGYLENNENHSACMLSAVHDNAQTWYLYMGDRGIVDWLLNKSMLATPPAGRLQTNFFRVAHIFQLLAMTYLAAQKGVDRVCFVSILVANYCFQYLLGDHKMARRWLEADRVSVEANTFVFSGRTPMVGAVHALSQAQDATWMETMIVPRPRMSAWLHELKMPEESRSQLDVRVQKLKLSPSDRSWVVLNTQLTIQAVDLIRSVLSKGRAVESLSVKKSS